MHVCVRMCASSCSGLGRVVPQPWGDAEPVPTGVLPSATPLGAAHGQRHAEVRLHAQRHHRAEEAGRGPVRSRHQVGIAEDQGPAGVAARLLSSQMTFLLLLPRNRPQSHVCVCLCVFKPDSDMDPNSSGEGVNSVSSSIKRGLSVDSAQEVKRFRTATGAISAVSVRARRVCLLLRVLRFLEGVCSFVPQILSVASVPSTVPKTQLGKAALNREKPSDTRLSRGCFPSQHTFFLMHV